MIFSEQHENTIAALGESKLIEQIQEWLGFACPTAPFGIGDDCAVLPNKRQDPMLLTTDSLCLNRHFDKNTPPQKAGAKLIKRNLSDIAAMGGVPGSAVLALLSGPNLSSQWLRGFFDGIRESCLQYGVSLVGGDVTQTEQNHFSAVLTLTGQTQKPVLRSSASPGHALYVTGSLGGSLLGKHLDFIPRLKEGQWLACQPDCTALMDLTDGLAKDLKQLLPNSCSASLNLEQIPLSQAVHSIADQTGKLPIDHAFSDGEDYELLFAVDEKMNPDPFIQRWQICFPGLAISRIGSIQSKQGQAPFIDSSNGKPLPWSQGYEHFAS
ncbi:MAG: thiamine-phosphate kinase [Coraliomargaritaceae bacterium]